MSGEKHAELMSRLRAVEAPLRKTADLKALLELSQEEGISLDDLMRRYDSQNASKSQMQLVADYAAQTGKSWEESFLQLLQEGRVSMGDN